MPRDDDEEHTAPLVRELSEVRAREQASTLGADAFLAKPFSLEELLPIVKSFASEG